MIRLANEKVRRRNVPSLLPFSLDLADDKAFAAVKPSSYPGLIYSGSRVSFKGSISTGAKNPHG